MALSGTLDTFALPDVLRLLASTHKTGRLRVSGGRGSGSVWVADGDVIATELVATNALAPTDVEVVFGLLRFESGSFTFEGEAIPPHRGEAQVMEPMLAAAETMLEEWRSIEAVVPSLDVWVGLTPELNGPDVMVDSARWRCIAAAGGGTRVGAVAEALELNEIETCRQVKELIELGLMELVDAPASADTVLFPPLDDDAGLDRDASSDDGAGHEVEDHDHHGGFIEEALADEPELDADDADHAFGDHDHEPHEDHLHIVADEDHDPDTVDHEQVEDLVHDEHDADLEELGAAEEPVGPSVVPSLAALASSDESDEGHEADDESLFGASASGHDAGSELNPAEMARQLANLSPKAAKAVAAAARAETDAERDAALAAVEAEDASVNRGMLLKFLGSVHN